MFTTQFTDEQCDEIQKHGYNSILPKMGFNRHFPRAVIFGPMKYQGKQLKDYKIFQYTSHLVRFVGYLRQDKDIGNLLRIQMDQHQMLIGSGAHFLELKSTDYPYGEKSRIQFLWGRNAQYKVTLKVQGAWKQKLAKHCDVFLMDKICSKIRITDTLVRLNNVRLYLRVSRLSDIVSEDGQWIHEWALHGPPALCKLKFPNRRKPLEQNMRL